MSKIVLLIFLLLSTVQSTSETVMGIGREYVEKVRAMDDDEKQELMFVFELAFETNFNLKL